MRFSPYLTGSIFGFVLAFSITWSYFKNFNSNAGFGIFILFPILIMGLIYGLGDIPGVKW
jgi:hypothetical protein